MNKAQEKIEIIENFWADISKNPPYDTILGIPQKHTRHGYGEKTGAYFTLNDMRDAVEFFDDWDEIEKHEGYSILEKNGEQIKYIWSTPVRLEYDPNLELDREKFEIYKEVV